MRVREGASRVRGRVGWERGVPKAGIDVVEAHGHAEARDGVGHDVVDARPVMDVHICIALQLGRPALPLGVLRVVVGHQVLERALVGVGVELTADEVDAEMFDGRAQRPSFTIGNAPPTFVFCEPVGPEGDGPLEPVIIDLSENGTGTVSGGVGRDHEGFVPVWARESDGMLEGVHEEGEGALRAKRVYDVPPSLPCQVPSLIKWRCEICEVGNVLREPLQHADEARRVLGIVEQPVQGDLPERRGLGRIKSSAVAPDEKA